VRVLLKEPRGRDVDERDRFSFNAGFTERLFRIKINAIQLKETEEENKKTNEQVMIRSDGFT
jgi:cullin 4